MLPRRPHRAVAAVVALASVVPVACGDDTDGAPAVLASPTFVSAPADPADDPQLDALDWLVDRSGERIARPSAVTPQRLATLSTIVADLEQRFGPDANVAHVSIGQPVVTLRSGRELTDWTAIPDRGVVSHPTPNPDARSFANPSLDVSLADVEPEVPRRLLAGIDRRTGGRNVASIELTELDERQPTWRLVVETGRSPATVTADLEGSVLAVRWWE